MFWHSRSRWLTFEQFPPDPLDYQVVTFEQHVRGAGDCLPSRHCCVNSRDVIYFFWGMQPTASWWHEAHRELHRATAAKASRQARCNTCRMRSHSALARLQKFTTLSSLFAAATWLTWHWSNSPLIAVTGFILISMAYSVVLALEFIALRYVGRDDPAPTPTWGELARAWWLETKAAPLVFCWRQPFRWNKIPDRPQIAPGQAPLRGAVFIHGFVCNRGFWNPWMERMQAMRRPFLAVNLEPIFGSIDDYIPIIEDAVTRLTQTTGLAPVLVCHSMGGLAARAWLREMSSHHRVHHVITIGCPHHGTWLGQFSHLSNGKQMRQRSAWLKELQRNTDAQRCANFTCWYSNCDNIVFPASNATLAGADNRLVRGAAHVHMAFIRDVMDTSLKKIET